MMTSPLVLPNDVVLVPVRELASPVRQQMACDEEDFAITRPRSRTPSKIVDPDTASLLQEFRTPQTVVGAILRYSRAVQADPEEILDAAFPVIENLFKARLLVPADSDASDAITASYQPGDTVDRFVVQRCVQVLEDTELYQVVDSDGQPAALKLARQAGNAMQRTFARERAVLRHLDGQVNPRFLGDGTVDGRHYLALEWCRGVNAVLAAETLRRSPDPQSRARLSELCQRIAHAYAHLHAQDVIHGDVHPRNLLVDDDGQVRIIDFGLARLRHRRNEFSTARRGGIAFFFEPEYARARLAGKRPPAASRAGEQYAVAVMLYLLLAGAHYLDFSIEKRAMLRQIAEDAPLSFADRGAPPWPAVEHVLGTALSKRSHDRYTSLADFAAALAAAAATEPALTRVPVHVESTSPVDVRPAQQLLALVMQRVGLAGHLLDARPTEAPTASVKMGAAGVAYALYRIASVQEDARQLALADRWADKAEQLVGQEDAFYNPALDLTPSVLGGVTPYHTASGIYAVQALIAHARGDFVSQQAAVDAYVRAAAAPCTNPDLTLGRAGVVLIGALLLETMRNNRLLDGSGLQTFGNDMLHGIWEQVGPYGPVPEDRQLAYLGTAHGWSGILYATLRWCQATGHPIPAAVEPRLRQLAGCAEPSGHGLRWRRKNARHSRDGRRHDRDAGVDYLSGWCNGSAGHIFLWTLAHRLFDDAAYLALAEGAAWHAWEDAESVGDLCCGLAGRAYGLLNLYKHSGEVQWLHRGQELAVRAADVVQKVALRRDGLYKGEVGVAVLATDLSRPQAACMPFFEGEGW